MSREPIGVAIVGAEGRMGRFASELLARTPGFRVAARIANDGELDRALGACGAQVGLDLTRAGLGYEHGARMLEHGVRPLIGTSGVTERETADLDAQARELGLGGLVVPNFSVGMWVLQRAAVEVARHLPRVEIVEMHHDKKRDAPSGTALDTAERLRHARGDAGEIPIHSVRLPGLYAHQIVLCSQPGELVSLRHDMSGPEAFASGILRGIEYASRAAGVGRGIGLALEG